MKKLLLILLCLPLIGFGQDSQSDSAIASNHYGAGWFKLDILGDYKGSIIDFTNAIDVMTNPNNNYVYSSENFKEFLLADVYTGRGSAYGKTEQWELQLNDLTSAITLREKIGMPDLGWYFSRGAIFYMIKDYALAIADWNYWRKNISDNEWVEFTNEKQGWRVKELLKMRGYCYFVLEDYENAILEYSTLIKDYGMQDQWLSLRARSYFFSNKYHSAISDINEILKTNEDAELICMKGVAYAMLNSKSLACSNFKKACNLGYKHACELSAKKDGVCFSKKIDRPSYQPKTITNSNKIELPIIVEGNMNYIMVTIGNKRYKYLIDTGASDMIINSDIERNLINLGYLKESDYRQPRVYEMANGKQITLKIANLSYIKIANNRFKNIDIAIGDDNASLLLGMSFINRFDWKITNNTLELKQK